MPPPLLLVLCVPVSEGWEKEGSAVAQSRPHPTPSSSTLMNPVAGRAPWGCPPHGVVCCCCCCSCWGDGDLFVDLALRLALEAEALKGRDRSTLRTLPLENSPICATSASCTLAPFSSSAV